MVIISFIHETFMSDLGVVCKEKLDANHSKGSNG